MAFGESFGAFAGGMNSGYSSGKSIQSVSSRRKAATSQPAVSTPTVSRQPDSGSEYEDQAWQMLRDLAAQQQPDEEGDEYNSYSASSSQSNSGMSISPSTIQQFMPSSSAGAGAGGGTGFGSLSLGGGTAGLGGSGLIGSAGGATSAASTGGASFGLGGSLVGGSGTVGGSTFAAGAGGSAAGGGAAAGGSSAAGGLASAGPWAALAAVIGFNEENARKKGFRDENRGKRLQDQITGKVLTQDIEGRWEPKLDDWTGGKASGWGFTGDMKGASEIGSFRFGKGLKTLWNDGTIGKIRKIFK